MKGREVFVNLFEACNNGRSLEQLHSQLIRNGFVYHSIFATKLVSLRYKYTSIEHARMVFDEMPKRTVYLWNAMLRSYCKEKQWKETLYLFNGVFADEKPDNFTVPIALKACGALREVKYGKMIHGFVKKSDKIGNDMFVGSALIELYSKCGMMGDAFRVFMEFSRPDVVLWTSMVSGYEQNGYPEEALSFFSRMVVLEGVSPDRVTLVSLVSACAKLSNSNLGRSAHCYVVKKGFDSNLSLTNSLLNLYAKTGSIRMAANLFVSMPEKDVISWSSMVACYALNGAAFEALRIVNEMIDNGIEPNSVTVVSALQASAISCNLKAGKKIHELAVRKGYELDVSVSTALVNMYMKCLSPDDAAELFERMLTKDVVSWVALLSGYALNGMAYKSMGVFRDMLWHDIQPDAIAMVKILAACSELGTFQQAVCLHCYVIHSGFDDNVFVGASLVELYSKCGSMDNAVKVFDKIIDKDVVIWSAVIAGYGIHGQGREALRMFNQMVQNSEVMPNNITFLSILSACSHTGLVEEGIELFHRMVQRYKLQPDSEHYGIMVDLLGRTGELDKAMEIINLMPIPAGPHVWGALLGACRIHNNIDMGEFAAMNLLQLDPNHAGYYILLSNIYAVCGKWNEAAKLRTMIKEKGLKKIYGQSVVEIRGEVHGFVADDRFHQDSQQIYRLLEVLDTEMRDHHDLDEDI